MTLLLKSYTNFFIQQGATILGWVLFIGTMINNHSERFNLHKLKLIRFLKNDSLVWNLRVDLEECQTKDGYYGELISNLRNNKIVDEFKELSSANGTYEFQINKLRYELMIEPCKTKLQIFIMGQSISYRESIFMIENEIEKILNVFQTTFGPKYSKFFLKIKYDGFNPDLEKVLSRSYIKKQKEYSIRVSSNAVGEYVITNDSLYFSADNYSDFTRLAKENLDAL